MRVKSYTLLAALLLIPIAITGCSSPIEPTATNGNSNGNISNLGKTASDHDWIFFVKNKENGGIFRARKNLSEEILLSDDQASFLNVLDGFIYYVNDSDEQKVYRMKTDGSQSSMISDHPSTFLVTDGTWLYALISKTTDPAENRNRIYRCRLDGSERSFLGEVIASQLNVSEDFLYCVSRVDGTLQRMRKDGSGVERIGDVRAGTLIVTGEKILFTNLADPENRIWSVEPDGQNAHPVSEDSAATLNLSGDWIYYLHPEINASQAEFKKVRMDGTGSVQVNEDIPETLSILDDLLFYQVEQTSTGDWKQVFTNLDGTLRKEYTAEGSAPEPETDPSPSGKRSGKPRIGLAWNHDVSRAYKRTIIAVELAEGEVVHLQRVTSKAEAERELARVDAIIFTGGGDLDPKYFDQEMIPNYPENDWKRIYEPRDISDLCLAEAALRLDVPTLGICRGFQLLNVVTGGSLIQDIPSQTDSDIVHRSPGGKLFVFHKIQIRKNSVFADIMGAGNLRVCSLHHQSIDKVGSNIVVVASSSDGIVEAIEVTGKSFALGVLYHPEYHIEVHQMDHLKIFKRLVEEAIKKIPILDLRRNDIYSVF